MTKEDNLKIKENIINKKFKESLDYKLNLENPKIFNEKIQWIKLYYYNTLITKCADKYLVIEYIKETIGKEYLILLLEVWDNPNDMDFDSLPNQFVLKVNLCRGQNIIVKDKSKLSIEETKEKLKCWVEPFSNFYYDYNYEWQYKNIKPKIICERDLRNDNTNNLIVYSVYDFNGTSHYIHVITDNHKNNDRLDIYNTNQNKLNIRYIFDNILYEVHSREYLYIMFDFAKKLSSLFKYIIANFFIVGVLCEN